MDQKNKEKYNPSEEELEALIKQLKELEENQKKLKKKKKRNFIAIEFGGVYHPNSIVDFLFSVIINISLAYLVIQLFSFATFDSLLYFIYFIVAYSILESVAKTYITIKFFSYIIKSFGFILYLTYILLLYILDIFVFVGNFTFNHEYHIVAFATIFIIIRYIIGTSIKRYLRRSLMR